MSDMEKRKKEWTFYYHKAVKEVEKYVPKKLLEEGDKYFLSSLPLKTEQRKTILSSIFLALGSFLEINDLELDEGLKDTIWAWFFLLLFQHGIHEHNILSGLALSSKPRKMVRDTLYEHLASLFKKQMETLLKKREEISQDDVSLI